MSTFVTARLRLRGISLLCALALSVAGIVHAAASDALETVRQNPALDTLISMVEKAGLATALRSPEAITLFAPSNEAFERLPGDIRRRLSEDQDLLAEVLRYHVAAGRHRVESLRKLNRLETAQGQSIEVGSGVRPTVDGAAILEADVQASNAVVHVIDRVLLPLGISRSQHYDLMDPDLHRVDPDRLPFDIRDQLYGR